MLKFRWLLEEHKLTERIFTASSTRLTASVIAIKESIFDDMAFIGVSSSIKNLAIKRNLYIHQAK